MTVRVRSQGKGWRSEEEESEGPLFLLHWLCLESCQHGSCYSTYQSAFALVSFCLSFSSVIIASTLIIVL